MKNHELQQLVDANGFNQKASYAATAAVKSGIVGGLTISAALLNEKVSGTSSRAVRVAVASVAGASFIKASIDAIDAIRWRSYSSEVVNDLTTESLNQATQLETS